MKSVDTSRLRSGSNKELEEMGFLESIRRGGGEEGTGWRQEMGKGK